MADDRTSPYDSIDIDLYGTISIPLWDQNQQKVDTHALSIVAQLPVVIYAMPWEREDIDIKGEAQESEETPLLYYKDAEFCEDYQRLVAYDQVINTFYHQTFWQYQENEKNEEDPILRILRRYLLGLCWSENNWLYKERPMPIYDDLSPRRRRNTPPDEEEPSKEESPNEESYFEELPWEEFPSEKTREDQDFSNYSESVRKVRGRRKYLPLRLINEMIEVIIQDEDYQVGHIKELRKYLTLEMQNDWDFEYFTAKMFWHTNTEDCQIRYQEIIAQERSNIEQIRRVRSQTQELTARNLTSQMQMLGFLQIDFADIFHTSMHVIRDRIYQIQKVLLDNIPISHGASILELQHMSSDQRTFHLRRFFRNVPKLSKQEKAIENLLQEKACFATMKYLGQNYCTLNGKNDQAIRSRNGVYYELVEGLKNRYGFQYVFIQDVSDFVTYVNNQDVITYTQYLQYTSTPAGRMQGNRYNRMFTCCERKLLAKADANGVPGTRHTIAIYVTLPPCYMCTDSASELELRYSTKKLRVKILKVCKNKKPKALQQKTDFDSYAALIHQQLGDANLGTRG